MAETIVDSQKMTVAFIIGNVTGSVQFS